MPKDDENQKLFYTLPITANIVVNIVLIVQTCIMILAEHELENTLSPKIALGVTTVAVAFAGVLLLIIYLKNSLNPLLIAIMCIIGIVFNIITAACFGFAKVRKYTTSNKLLQINGETIYSDETFMKNISPSAFTMMIPNAFAIFMSLICVLIAMLKWRKTDKGRKGSSSNSNSKKLDSRESGTNVASGGQQAYPNPAAEQRKADVEKNTPKDKSKSRSGGKSKSRSDKSGGKRSTSKNKSKEKDRSRKSKEKDDDRDRDRDRKSREKDRDRDRDRSRSKSDGKKRDRSRGSREKDRDRDRERDRDRDRERSRDKRDRSRSDKDRDRDRRRDERSRSDKSRGRDRDRDRDRERSRDKRDRSRSDKSRGRDRDRKSDNSRSRERRRRR